MYKRGQVSIFVIVAVVVVALVVLFFAFRGNLFGGSVPAEFVPIYNLYSGCIEQETETALDLLGSQGGVIDFSDFEPGSDFAPFSNSLNFAGIQVPYWYYVSGNGLIKEYAPLKSEMEVEVEEFLESRINECDFSEFYAQGFFIELGEPTADVVIEDDRVEVNVESDVSAYREDKSARKISHEIEVKSKMGGLYNTARAIYDKQKQDLFLEDYAVDTLRLHAPVDGVEVQCSPAIWKTRDVVDELKTGLESNVGAIKFKGDYYDLNAKEDEYFVVDDVIVNEQVNVLYSKQWPSKVEITPADDELIIAEPVGNQEGLGILGFCYVPYHFVYDLSFPTLIQVSDGFEIFQFPVIVIVDNNLPRKADLISLVEEEESDVCSFAEGEAEIYTYDTNLNPVEADVSYNCFNSFCRLGKTEILDNSAVLKTDIPICVNGYLIAKADGFAEQQQLFSSNSESFADIILEQEYEVEVELKMNGEVIRNNTAVVHFSNVDGGTVSAVLPESTNVDLKEGLYNIEVFVYGNSQVVIPSSRKVQCYDSPRSGILGIFGSTREECVDIEIPSTKIDYALAGGGKTSTFILASELEKGRVVIDVSALPRANSLEQLQYNYEIFNSLGVDLEFG